MSEDFDRARRHFVDGLQCFAAGDMTQAEQQFRASLALLPDRPSTLSNLGATLVQLGRPLEALAPLAQALAQAPGDVHALAQQGLALARLQRDDEALAAFDPLLAADPAQAAARFERAKALNRLGRHADALADFDQLLAQGPASAELWLQQARTLHSLDRHDQALASYARALAVDPTLAPAWGERGALLKDAGQLAQAADCFERAIALGADTELNRYFLAAVTGGAAPPAPPGGYVERLFDAYADNFESHLVEQLHYQAPQRLTQHLDGLRAGRFRAALDLGCGTGLCGPLLGPFVARVDGIDLSRRMLAKARATGAYDELVHADLVQHLDTTTARHDLVLATDTFIYIGELDPVFAGVRRVLDAGGVFCFSAERADDKVDFVLGAGSRYAHSERYLRALAVRHGFVLQALHRQVLREEQRRPVAGLFVYLTLPPATA